MFLDKFNIKKGQKRDKKSMFNETLTQVFWGIVLIFFC